MGASCQPSQDTEPTLKVIGISSLFLGSRFSANVDFREEQKVQFPFHGARIGRTKTNQHWPRLYTGNQAINKL